MAWSFCPQHPAALGSPPCAKVVFSKAVTVSPWCLTAGPKARLVLFRVPWGEKLTKNQGSILRKWRNLSVCQWFTCWRFLLFTVLLVILLACCAWFFYFALFNRFEFCLLLLTALWSNLPLLPISCLLTFCRTKKTDVLEFKAKGTLKFQMQWIFVGEKKLFIEYPLNTAFSNW